VKVRFLAIPLRPSNPADEWGKDVGGALSGAKVPSLTASVNHATAVAAIQLGSGITTSSEEIFADQ
jgi:hypothetical protein